MIFNWCFIFCSVPSQPPDINSDFVVEQLQEEEELGEPTDPVQEHEGEVEEPLPGVGEQFEGARAP